MSTYKAHFSWKPAIDETAVICDLDLARMHAIDETAVICDLDLARVHGGQDPTDPKSTPQNSSTSTTTTTNTNTTTNKGADDAYYCKNGLDFSLKLNGHVKISSATGQTIEGDANGMYTKCK